MGTVSDVIAGGTEGAVQQGPVRARVLNDLSAEEKERAHSSECPRTQIVFKFQDYLREMRLLMQAQENGAVVDEEQRCFLRRTGYNLNEDVDNSPRIGFWHLNDGPCL
ncbi:hypothetical protein Tco_0309057 [Tanacetum coccineum]